jgi:hypothetical protein
VVDLGTRFGLTTSSIGNSQVHVFEGEVEVGAAAGGERKRLTEGKGLHVGIRKYRPGTGAVARAGDATSGRLDGDLDGIWWRQGRVRAAQGSARSDRARIRSSW